MFNGRHSMEMQPPKPPEGRQLRYWKAPVAPEDKEAAELESCRLLFNQAGHNFNFKCCQILAEQNEACRVDFCLCSLSEITAL